MKLNDFHVGDIAYQLSTYPENEIREVKVVKIGRKYITTQTVGYYFERKFCLSTGKYGIEFLIENRDWGDKDLLFKSKEEIALYLEAKSLKQYLLQLIRTTTFENLTLDQMRKIKDIMKGEEST